MVDREFRRCGINNPTLLDEAFLVLAGPALYIARNDPHLLNPEAITPVEDDALMQASLGSIKAMEEALSKLVEVTRQYPSFQDYMRKVTASLSSYTQVESREDTDILIDAIRHAPLGAASATSDYLRHLSKATHFLQERGRRSVAKITKIKGSGVLLIGAKPLSSVVDLLMQSCFDQAPDHAHVEQVSQPIGSQ